MGKQNVQAEKVYYPQRQWFRRLTLRALALRRHFPIRLRSWGYERWPFVVTFPLDNEADVSPSSSLSDEITKLTLRALALRQSEWRRANANFSFKETVVQRRWQSETWKFGFTKRVDEGRITTVKARRFNSFDKTNFFFRNHHARPRETGYCHFKIHDGAVKEKNVT